MIRNLVDVYCPYCDATRHSFDFDTGRIVLNPDSADQAPCEHLTYAYYSSCRHVVDDCWIHPGLPKTSEVLDFFAEAVHSKPEWLNGATDHSVMEHDIDLSAPSSVLTPPATIQDIQIHVCILWAHRPLEFLGHLERQGVIAPV